jgi:mono/diheme cytochrome c family protein
MLKPGLTFVLACVVWTTPAPAQHQSPRGVELPLRPTSPTSGPEMYAAYCSGCHGVGGRSDGRIAPALRTRPPDLTVLTQKNGGVFPYNHVVSVLRFGPANSLHGSADMPIWGEMFQTLNAPGQIEVEVRVRIIHLTDYLKTIQR